MICDCSSSEQLTDQEIGSCLCLRGRDWIEFLSLAEAAIEQGQIVLQRENQGVWIGRTGHYRNIRFPETRIIRFGAISKKGKCRLAGTWTAGTPLGFFPSRSEYPVGFGPDYPVTSSTEKFWSLAVFLRVSFRSEYPVGYGSDYPVSTSTGCDGNVVIPR